MNTTATDVTFRVWQTFRTGLDVGRRKLLTIIALALVSRFMASHVVSGITTFANTTFGLDLASMEQGLVFFGSLLVMWPAVVPLTIQTIDTPPRIGVFVTPFERIWRDASVHYRAVSLRTFLRGLGLVLIGDAMFMASMQSSWFWDALLRANADHESWTANVLAVIGACAGLLVVWVSLRWSVALPAMIMENVSVLESLRRSWQITRSQVLRLVGLGILTYAVVSVLSVLLFGIISMALVRMVFVPFFVDSGEAINSLDALWRFVDQTVGLVVLAPITSACYYHLRGN